MQFSTRLKFSHPLATLTMHILPHIIFLPIAPYSTDQSSPIFPTSMPSSLPINISLILPRVTMFHHKPYFDIVTKVLKNTFGRVKDFAISVGA